MDNNDNIPDIKPEVVKGKMTQEEAGSKGERILGHIAEIYELIDWVEAPEDGDPYVKVSLYKSGKISVENYRDTEPAEFNMEQILRNDD
jgi:hypothetical protein